MASYFYYVASQVSNVIQLQIEIKQKVKMREVFFQSFSQSCHGYHGGGILFVISTTVWYFIYGCFSLCVQQYKTIIGRGKKVSHLSSVYSVFFIFC